MNKVLSVLAVVAILGVSFYAGQKSFGSSLEYEHADVIDVAKQCTWGQEFIGGCKKCGECGATKPGTNAREKYKAGGCSYFKDTFCTLCNSIRNCKQENTWCTNKSDQYCDQCNPGFFGPQCQPCKQCSNTEYVFKACVTQPAVKGEDSDTVCKPCTQCTLGEQGKRSFLIKPCDVGGNGVLGASKNPGEGTEKKDSRCRACRVCLEGFEYTSKTCESPFQLGYFQDPQNTGPNKLPADLKLQEIEQDKAKAVQQYTKAGVKKMPEDTQCKSCTGCMHSKHPDLLDNKKKYMSLIPGAQQDKPAWYDAKNKASVARWAALKAKTTLGGWYQNKQQLKLYATNVCANVVNPKTKLFEERGAQKCAACRNCKAGHYISKPCDPGHPHKEWRCKAFKVDAANGKVEISGQTEQCKIAYDPTTRKPIVAKDEELVTTIPAAKGSDTECAKCTPRPASHWTVFPCNPSHTSDAVHQRCSVCQQGEYQYQKCKDYSDTICPSCPSAREKLYKNSKEFKSGLQYCKIDPETGLPKTQCDATLVQTLGGNQVVVPKSTRCGHWKGKKVGNDFLKPFKWTHDDKVGHRLPKNPDRCVPWTRQDVSKFNQCGEWQSECKDDFFGPSCCYHKHPYSCGVITTRERSAKRMKYPTDEAKLKPTNQFKSNPNSGYPKEGYFAQWCMSICSEFPDCLAVELEDNGTYENPAGTPDEMNKYKKCFFKSAFTQDQKYRWKAAFVEIVDGKEVKREGDPKMDCYSNTCRQNIYTMSGDKPMRILNYRVPKKAKTQAQLNSEMATTKCSKKCTPVEANNGCKTPCPAGSPLDCIDKCIKKTIKSLAKSGSARLQAVAKRQAAAAKQ